MPDWLIWFGIGLSLLAKILMAKQRFVAVRILMVGTLISFGWACYLMDKQSIALHLVSFVLQIRTYRAWKAGA